MKRRSNVLPDALSGLERWKMLRETTKSEVSFRLLYGVQVPTAKYEVIKTIADALAGETTTQVYLADARRHAVKLAIKALLDIMGRRFRGPESRLRNGE